MSNQHFNVVYSYWNVDYFKPKFAYHPCWYQGTFFTKNITSVNALLSSVLNQPVNKPVNPEA